MQSRMWAIIAGFLIFLMAFPAAAAEKGEAYYDLGVFALEDGYYKNAEDNFLKALRFQSNNPYYNYYLGKTYLEMGRYDQADRYFAKAAAIDPAIPNLSYDRGLLAYKTEGYAAAARHFEQAVTASPTNVLAAYYAGVSLFKLDRYSSASNYLLRAAQQSPSVRGQAYYYAGISFQRSGNSDRAKEMFRLAKEYADTDELRESADRWLRSVERRQAAEKPYTVYFKLGRRYDDNVRLEPLDIDLFTDESDGATELYFTGSYDLYAQNPYTFGLGYSLYRTWHDDLDEYDLTGSIGNIYGSYSLAPFTFRLSYQPVYYWVDSDSYLKRHRIRPEVFWSLGERLDARLFYTYYRDDYEIDEDRSGHTNEIFGGLYYRLRNNLALISGGMGYERNSASKLEAYDQWLGRLDGLFYLPWELNFGVTASYRSRTYDMDREDDRYELAFTLSRAIYQEWLGLLAEYSYTRNSSNIELYEYDRNVFTLSLTARFE